MKAALIQIAASMDRSESLAAAERELRAAAAQGADLAVLPEMFCCPYAGRFFRPYGEVHGGPAQQLLSALAADLHMWIIGGSLPELEGDRIYNTSFVYDRSGREAARHRKVHLFDIAVDGGQCFRESDTLTPGDRITVFDTEFGRFGLCICFDLRFQELTMLMAQQGALAVFAPAAFNMTTGPAHWETTFRQRAVDNQIFMVGVSQARNESFEYVSYGNSMAVDPWGTVLCRCGGEACTQLVTLELEKAASIRRQLPILSARRTDLYGILDRPSGRLF